MLNPKRRTRLSLWLLIIQCLLVLNCHKTSQIGISSNIINSVLSLEELAALDFPWAKKTLERYRKGLITQDGSPLINSNDQKEKDLFLNFTFYRLLNLRCNRLLQVEYIASLLKTLFEYGGAREITLDPLLDYTPDILMLYATLSQDPTQASPTIQRTINPKHVIFVENLASLAFYLGTEEAIDRLEVLCLDWKEYVKYTGVSPEKEDNKTSEAMRAYNFIHNKLDVQLLRSTAIFNYIHPLNTSLYLAGLNYKYDAKEKAFVVVKNTIFDTEKDWAVGITDVAQFTFKDAVRLSYAPSATYTIVVQDECLETFKNAVEQYLRPKEYKSFHRDINKHIRTFKEYKRYKRSKRQNYHSAGNENGPEN
ncbi:hypothetical protein NEHOM01_1920 [Nematocida homosporus]|uniref:uncharacterized protein n=1 Tax=Nematocida homosporus TaxID=1912981 RepID=UPI00221F048F|nr:uncharacterized protein NEHOM01_1920 [Nematocida homosporus]KAI5187087.1 hypothetical protein NEHOM01_1920 [Nematocida homosporus]